MCVCRYSFGSYVCFIGLLFGHVPYIAHNACGCEKGKILQYFHLFFDLFLKLKMYPLQRRPELIGPWVVLGAIGIICSILNFFVTGIRQPTMELMASLIYIGEVHCFLNIFPLLKTNCLFSISSFILFSLVSHLQVMARYAQWQFSTQS